MHRLIGIITTSFLASSLTFTTACSSAAPDLQPVDRPPPGPVLTQGCPPPPPMPPRSSLPANDVRPIVAILALQVDAGDQCRIVVEGWKAWDGCMRARVKDPKAPCADLDTFLQQLAPAEVGRVQFATFVG